MKKAAAFSLEVKSTVLTRSQGFCELCGRWVWDNQQFHHRIPRGMGGTRNPLLGQASNCLLLHFRCHERIERNRTEALENGWLCYRGADPEAVPVLYRGRFVLLGPDGEVSLPVGGQDPVGKPDLPPSSDSPDA